MDLDELLNGSAPPTASRTADLERELHRMVAEAESAARPGRRRVRLGLRGGLATVLIGLIGAGGTMASGLVPTPSWVPWTTPAGTKCSFAAVVEPADPGSGEVRLTRGLTKAETQRAHAEAELFLKSFDYDSIDQAAAIRKVQRERANAAYPAEGGPPETEDDLAISAVGQEVWRQLEAHLTAKGINPHAVSYSLGWRCGDDT